MTIVEGPGSVLAHVATVDAIQFDLRQVNSIFDDIVLEVDQSADKMESGLGSKTTTRENDRTEGEIAAGVDLDDLTYYSGLQHILRPTTGKPLERLTY